MNEGFLSRWSRRKHDSRRVDEERDPAEPASAAKEPGTPAPAAQDRAAPASAVQREPQQPSPQAHVRSDDGPLASAPGGAPSAPAAQRRAPDSPSAHAGGTLPGQGQSGSAPTELPPIESLTPESDFRAFMQPGVDSTTRNAALAQLFRDPHYSVMDGLDVYIDDYTQPDPIAPPMLAKLKQLHEFGLADEEIERRPPALAAVARSEGGDAGEAAREAAASENDASANNAGAGETRGPEPADDSTGERTKPQEPQQ